jgi:hypothetical protein
VLTRSEVLFFDEIVQILKDRLGASDGRAIAIIETAINSREVRHHCMDDMNPLGYLRQYTWLAREDFLDWLDRHYPKKGRRGKNYDWDALKEVFFELMATRGDYRKPFERSRDWKSHATACRAMLEKIKRGKHKVEGDLPHWKNIEKMIAQVWLPEWDKMER